ncbi:MAG: dihydrodipicolinate synthase family protein [Rhodoglobus sp.]
MTSSSGIDSKDPAYAVLHAGTVIPAHLLALTAQRTLDETRQRALTRYYLDSGVGGLAVGVHTTQFGIRERGLYSRVLELAAEESRTWTSRPIALVAGLIGDTEQARDEARTAVELGYHAGLLNLAALKSWSEDQLLEHCRTIAAEIPLIGFALLPEVGGFHLSFNFWRQFAEIENVIAIKMAPFNRYRTLEIVRAVVAAHAENRVALYTGNDDHIVLDLLQPFAIPRGNDTVTVRIRGGLLGHWSVWTHAAVEQFAEITAPSTGASNELLALDSVVTDCNSAIYDAANDFAGCIPGCHEVLRRQGLFEGVWCLDENETLSPGQLEEIDRVYSEHPQMNDDNFVRANLSRWLDEHPATHSAPTDRGSHHV